MNCEERRKIYNELNNIIFSYCMTHSCGNCAISETGACEAEFYGQNQTMQENAIAKQQKAVKILEKERF